MEWETAWLEIVVWIGCQCHTKLPLSRVTPGIPQNYGNVAETFTPP